MALERSVVKGVWQGLLQCHMSERRACLARHGMWDTADPAEWHDGTTGVKDEGWTWLMHEARDLNSYTHLRFVRDAISSNDDVCSTRWHDCSRVTD